MSPVTRLVVVVGAVKFPARASHGTAPRIGAEAVWGKMSMKVLIEGLG